MNIAEARKLLTHRHSRIHDVDGSVYIGLSMEDAEAIAGLLPPEIPIVHPEQPVYANPQSEGVLTTASTERAVEAKPEPVRTKKGRRKR